MRLRRRASASGFSSAEVLRRAIIQGRWTDNEPLVASRLGYPDVQIAAAATGITLNLASGEPSTYEAVRGRPPSDKALNLLTAIGMAAVLALMIFGLSNDLFCP